jgi:hypothetical protein
VNDKLEVLVLFTDPRVADVPPQSTWTEVAARSGNQFSASLGDWVREPSSAYSGGRGGFAEYSMNVPSDGSYAIELTVAEHNPLITGTEFDITVSVDGRDSGRQVIRMNGATGTGLYMTPLLTAGTHTIRVLWNDFTENSVLEILNIRLLDLGGTDSDLNGLTDWLDVRLRNTSGVATQALESIVSPVCLEGSSLELARLEVSASYIPEGMTEQTIAAHQALGRGWYADVQLSPSNATTITVSDQAGFLAYTNVVEWVPVNVIEGLYTNVLIREGSAMLLTAYPTNQVVGAVGVTVCLGTNVMTNVVTDIAHPFEYGFAAAGDYTVFGSFSNAIVQTNAAMQVSVRGGGFAADPAVAVGQRSPQSRIWACPSLPAEVAIEYDNDLSVTTNALAGGGLNFNLNTSVSDVRYIVARLGNEGPILDVAKVTGLRGDATSRYLVDAYVLRDGSTEILSLRLNIGPVVPDDLTVSIELWPAGLTFDDGTRSRIVTADDFNELGEYRYTIIRPFYTPRCHYLQVFSGGDLIMDF